MAEDKQKKLEELWGTIEKKTDPDVFNLITDLVALEHEIEKECNQ